MKKALVVLLVLATVFTAVFAQGASEAKANEKMELVLLSAGKESESEKIIEAFNKEYPNITVTHLEKDSGDVLTLVQQKSSDSDVVLLIAQDSLVPMEPNLYAYTTVNDAKFVAVGGQPGTLMDRPLVQFPTPHPVIPLPRKPCPMQTFPFEMLSMASSSVPFSSILARALMRFA